MPLSVRRIAAAKAGRHSDGGGLYLLVQPSGSKSWVLRVREADRRPRSPGTSRQRPAAAPRAVASGSCNIKGNRSRRGEWIYHVPGMPYYEQTRPEELFCSEADARAAGYRRALVR